MRRNSIFIFFIFLYYVIALGLFFLLILFLVFLYCSLRPLLYRHNRLFWLPFILRNQIRQIAKSNSTSFTHHRHHFVQFKFPAKWLIYWLVFLAFFCFLKDLNPFNRKKALWEVIIIRYVCLMHSIQICLLCICQSITAKTNHHFQWRIFSLFWEEENCLFVFLALLGIGNELSKSWGFSVCNFVSLLKDLNWNLRFLKKLFDIWQFAKEIKNS